MKNTIKIVGIISLMLVIGFSFAACSDGGGGVYGGGSDSSVTYTYSDDDGNAYKLKITEAGRAAHKAGDNYALTITFKADGKIKTSTGKVTAFIDNNFTLQSSDNKVFFITVTNSGSIGAISGDVPAVLELPQGKEITINNYVNSKFDLSTRPDLFLDPDAKKADNEFYGKLTVAIIDNLQNVLNEETNFFSSTARQTTLLPKNTNKANYTVKLQKYGTVYEPWTGTGDYYVILLPVLAYSTIGYFNGNACMIYTNGTENPVKYSIGSGPLDISKFKIWDPWNYYHAMPSVTKNSGGAECTNL